MELHSCFYCVTIHCIFYGTTKRSQIDKKMAILHIFALQPLNTRIICMSMWSPNRGQLHMFELHMFYLFYILSAFQNEFFNLSWLFNFRDNFIFCHSYIMFETSVDLLSIERCAQPFEFQFMFEFQPCSIYISTKKDRTGC